MVIGIELQPCGLHFIYSRLLLLELPQFYEKRVEYFQPSLQALIRSQVYSFPNCFFFIYGNQLVIIRITIMFITILQASLVIRFRLRIHVNF
jgi:hypothetical protein